MSSSATWPLALWNTEDGKKVLDIVGPSGYEIFSFTISEDGSVVAISEVTGEIILFDRVNRRHLQTIHYIESREVPCGPCGLMLFTSDKNTLVCGFLGITFRAHRDSYKGFFYEPPEFAIFSANHESYFDQLHPKTFRLWPCDSSGTLDLKDFVMRDKSCYWLREVDKVIPSSFLYAGSYIRFDKSALVGSPASKYITMLNTDVAFDSRNGGEVKAIACSLKGNTIYSTTSEFFKDSFDTNSNVTLVTVLRMSKREVLDRIELPGCVSIFPTRDGVVLLKNGGACAELWTFDMSTSLRYLSEVTPGDVVFSISEERIARLCSPRLRIGSESDPIQNLVWQHIVIQFLDVTGASSKIVPSLEIFLDFSEHLLSVVCSRPSEALLCTASEKVTISLWKNGVIQWERTCWTDTTRIITAIKPQMLFSPKSELVVTWNTLDQGHGLHILNADTGETLHVFLGDQTDIAIVDCKFLDDESLVCCSEDNFLRLYNLEAGDLLSVLDIGEQPFCLGACLYQPLVAIGLSGARTKFIHVQLPKETKKKERLVSFLFNSFLGTEIN